MKYAIFAFALLVAFLAVHYGRKLFSIWKKMKNWNVAEAKIISKNIGKKKLASGTRANSVLLVEYEFSLDEKLIHGNTVFPIEFLKGEKGFLLKQAEKELAKISDRMPVRYDPADPSRNILFPGGPGLALLMICMGIFSLLFGLFYVVVM
ncbi:MAG TPA: DUF3592 domain-containing protein [Bacteroidia bacterium]|jgi:hypothetical protein|nr:DUF3592 domain-containing protein [Bacteroidia bacterium]